MISDSALYWKLRDRRTARFLDTKFTPRKPAWVYQAQSRRMFIADRIRNLSHNRLMETFWYT